MTRASILSALALSVGLFSLGCGGGGGGGGAAEFKAVSALLTTGTCGTGTCHGANAMMPSGKTNRLKFIASMDTANCASAAALIDKTKPENSRLATYSYDAAHTGMQSPGWENATAAGPKAVVAWATAGGGCP